MALAQALKIMKRESERTNLSMEKLNGAYDVSTGGKEMQCAKNCEDYTFDMEPYFDQPNTDETNQQDIDIVGCSTSYPRLLKPDDPDGTETEHSSSFGNTISASDNGLVLSASDAEVDSFTYRDNGSSTCFDGFDGRFQMKKKKLTPHWRRYIRPLMWRCKWLELRMKELRSQALKYDKELFLCQQQKQMSENQLAKEGSARTEPFIEHDRKKHIMRRHRRRRIEDKADISSYMSRHNLFSCYEQKRSDAECASVDDDWCSQVIPKEVNLHKRDEFELDCDWLSFDPPDGEQSPEKILYVIDTQLSRVMKLIILLEKLSDQHGFKLSLENSNLDIDIDHPSTSTQSPTASLGNLGTLPAVELCTPPGQLSDIEIEDLIIPESVLSSFDDSTSITDVIQSTRNMLSAVDPSLDHSQTGDCCDDNIDDVLINNQALEVDLHDFDVGQAIQKPHQPVKEERDVNETMQNSDKPIKEAHFNRENQKPHVVEEVCVNQDKLEQPIKVEVEAGTIPFSQIESPNKLKFSNSTQESSMLRSCLASEFYVPKNKRKRGERKAGVRSWKASKYHVKEEPQ